MKFYCEIINRNIDLIYSPDDGGYFLERYDDDGKAHGHSPVMKSRLALLKAYYLGKIKWQEY